MSEIKTGSDSWTLSSEFVVTNPQMIYPRYLLTFDLDQQPGKSDSEEFGWVKGTRCENERCVRNDRCDCSVLPLAIYYDVVEHKITKLFGTASSGLINIHYQRVVSLCSGINAL